MDWPYELSRGRCRDGRGDQGGGGEERRGGGK